MECVTATEVLGYIGLVIIAILVGATAMGLIDWSDPKGLK